MTSSANSRSRISGYWARVPFRLCRAIREPGRSSLFILAGPVLAVVLAVPASAASLGGTITYKTRSMAKPDALPSAIVSVYHTSSGRKTVTRTNSAGVYLFRSLPGGLYVILVEKDGKRVYQGKVEVRDQDARFDIGL